MSGAAGWVAGAGTWTYSTTVTGITWMSRPPEALRPSRISPLSCSSWIFCSSSEDACGPEMLRRSLSFSLSLSSSRSRSLCCNALTWEQDSRRLSLSSSVSLVACMSSVSSSDIFSEVRFSISSSRVLSWALCSCRSPTCSSTPPLFSASSSRAPTSNTLSR